MIAKLNLEIDVLRTFVTGFELGSFARAAERLGRSPSAISAQLSKLEERIGQPLTRKAGRGLALTEAGESLLGYARRILELNDEAVERLRGAEVAGWVRLGLPQDFAELWLPSVLARFARAHPKVQVEVRTERNARLVERAVTGELDLALAWGDGAGAPHAEKLAQLDLVWIGRPGFVRPEGEPLPLVAFEPPCVFRDAGLAALDAAGVPWRVAFTSPSLAGLWAGAEAGLGVALRTRIGVPRALVGLDPVGAGLPSLPTLALALHRAEAEPPPAAARLAEILRETVSDAASSVGVGA